MARAAMSVKALGKDNLVERQIPRYLFVSVCKKHGILSIIYFSPSNDVATIYKQRNARFV